MTAQPVRWQHLILPKSRLKEAGNNSIVTHSKCNKLIYVNHMNEGVADRMSKTDAATTPTFRLGSFATELVKVDAGTCPLRSESDRNIAVPRMNAIAKSGPTTPASGCISCRGYQASDFNHSRRIGPPPCARSKRRGGLRFYLAPPRIRTRVYPSSTYDGRSRIYDCRGSVRRRSGGGPGEGAPPRFWAY